MLLAKILAPAATVALGLGLAALSPQDGPAPDAKPVEVTKTVEVVADPVDVLNDLYTRLRKIRSERLPEKPKKLADSAAKLYRQALEAIEQKDEAKARALLRAASELTRALELTRGNGDEAPADPDLPPPPRRNADRVFLYRRDATVIALPPVIRDQDEVTARVVEGAAPTGAQKGVITFRVPGAGEVKGTITAGNVRIHHVESEGQPEKRDVVVERHLVEGEEKVAREVLLSVIRSSQDQAEAEHARALAVLAQSEVAKALHAEAEALDKKDGKLRVEVRLQPEMRQAVTRLRLTEAHAKLQETLAGVKSKDNALKLRFHVVESGQGQKVDAGNASEDLNRAYEAVTQARKTRKKSDDANYLDAARDLYNAARREAEAKRFDHAVELARAAEALTRADHALGALRLYETHVIQGTEVHGLSGLKILTEDIKGDGTLKIVAVPAHPGDAKAEAKKSETRQVEVHVGGSEKAKPHADAHQAEQANEEVETTIVVVPTKPGDPKPEGETRRSVIRRLDPKIADLAKVESGESHEGDVQGIGVMIASIDDGKALVQDLMKGGPAEKDGRIKAGDSLVGVVNDKGAIVGFADKPIADVTKLIRGPGGSKVKIVVQPKDSSDL